MSNQDSNILKEYCPQNEDCIKEKQILSQGEDENLTIYGYKSNTCKSSTTYIFYFLTLGILRLIFHWFPKWRLYATHSKCNLKIAEKILVVDNYQKKVKSYFVEKIHVRPSSSSFVTVNLGDGYVKEMSKFRAVWCKKLCYVWDEQKSEFVKLVGLEKGRMCADFYQFQGLSQQERLLRFIAYGKNVIEVPVYTVLTLLLFEALTPFYVFQVFSLIVWLNEEYYYYGIAIVIMSCFGITTSIIQTRKNQRRLLKTVQEEERITVFRGDGEFEEISSTDVVPGDLIKISENGCIMQCDAVLLNGNCIVNESMLTGESVPVTKTPIPKINSYYNIKEDSFHTLFCGTKVIQTRNQANEQVLAVVLRTGFLTSKGELVRSILYPPPSDFKFDRESYYFIGILAVIALLGSLYTIISKSQRSIALSDIVLKTLDLITVVIPPALPAAMTVGKLYALNRLKKQDIYCINSRVINVSGSIDCVCFDKTGTLTEEGLDLWGVIPIETNKLKTVIKQPATISSASHYLRGMAVCHSLTTINGKLLGDPLDVKIFESTGWKLEEDHPPCSLNSVKPPQSCNNNQSIEILRQFPFQSNLQRMSVVTKSSSNDFFEVFCKGSSEMIAKLSKPETIPSDLCSRIKDFTEKGYRVIALGYKTINYICMEDVHILERNLIESDLEIVGLIILVNRIKNETPETIKILKEACIKIVMITGDDFHTALSVAKECGIITSHDVVVDVTVDHQNLLTLMGTGISNEKYCTNEISLERGVTDMQYVYTMTGTTWELVRKHYPDQIPELVSKGVVFARMFGFQKQQLIQELQKLGFYTAMCGDGANDCGALKAAHVGISLSEEEASVASPFTAKNSDVSCVPKVIKEGRAALITSMGIFKFMICYSLTQFTSILILYGIDCNLGSMQFLFIDLCLIINFTSMFGKTEAYHGDIGKNSLLSSLLSLTALSSMTFQLCFVIMFQLVSYKLIQTYAWFTPYVFQGGLLHGFDSYENYSVFCSSLFQYIILAIAFSQGKPYRQPMYTNKLFLMSLIFMTGVCMYITLNSPMWLNNILELKLPPTYNARLMIIALVLLQFICSIIVEEIVVGFFLDKKIRPKLREMMSRSDKTNLNVLKLQHSFTETVVSVNNEVSQSKNAKINKIGNGIFIPKQVQVTKL